eukprot:TRINITY_DN13916_c0_g1_i1.p2 TRINITY_DN13916_c0_g1~~TRINITY_DN13916_c0_g1_i1.p2  ORF type:complete len:195 (-),score=20.93 TRINITY_DN13916_c0_g1_i1:151-735(-)
MPGCELPAACKQLLKSTLSLLPYPDPHNCPMSHLVSESHRHGVADVINATLLLHVKRVALAAEEDGVAAAGQENDSGPSTSAAACSNWPSAQPEERRAQRTEQPSTCRSLPLRALRPGVPDDVAEVSGVETRRGASVNEQSQADTDLDWRNCQSSLQSMLQMLQVALDQCHAQGGGLGKRMQVAEAMQAGFWRN